MKFGLHSVFIWVNIQEKFQVPRSHSIGEKCDANFKLSSHFLKTVRPSNMKFGLHSVFIWVEIQKKFQVPRCTVLEKNAMLTCKIQSCL